MIRGRGKIILSAIHYVRQIEVSSVDQIIRALFRHLRSTKYIIDISRVCEFYIIRIAFVDMFVDDEAGYDGEGGGAGGREREI